MAMGFGESIEMVFVVPILLLFSYTRIPKNKTLSLFVPVIAIALIVLIFLEGFYQGLASLPMQKFALSELLPMLQEMLQAY